MEARLGLWRLFSSRHLGAGRIRRPNPLPYLRSRLCNICGMRVLLQSPARTRALASKQAGSVILPLPLLTSDF